MRSQRLRTHFTMSRGYCQPIFDTNLRFPLPRTIAFRTASIGNTAVAKSIAKSVSRVVSGTHLIAAPPNSTSANCTSDAAIIMNANSGLPVIPASGKSRSVRTENERNMPRNIHRPRFPAASFSPCTMIMELLLLQRQLK